jgi:hypothetical protein
VADKQGRFFKALANITRLRVLKLLGVREMCIREVIVALLFENAGLVKGSRKAIIRAVSNVDLGFLV